MAAESIGVTRRKFLEASAIGGAAFLVGCQRGSDSVSIAGDSLATPTDSPAITHRTVKVNGINMHIAEAGKGLPVIFLHGFSELWYSWRHQLPVTAAAGFHAVAPDQRGYGGTDAPPNVADYSMKYLTADVVGLLDALGAEKGVLVANDWGSGVAWSCAQLYPDRVAGLFQLNIPYSRRGSEAPTAFIRKFANGHFNVALYFQDPGVAEAELEKNPRDMLRRFRYALSGDAPPGTIEYLFMKKPAGTGLLEGMPNPTVLPGWLSEADIDYQAREFQRTGFRGALNWYRNMDSDWRAFPKVGTTDITQPVSFMGGRKDPTMIYAPLDDMISSVPKLRQIVFVENSGHWIQEERPGDVNRELVEFLRREIGGRSLSF